MQLAHFAVIGRTAAFSQIYYIFYYIEDMKLILLPVIECRGYHRTARDVTTRW